MKIGARGETEAELQVRVAEYLRLQYPDVLFHSDFGSGVKLTIGQAVRQKRQNGGKRAWPDLFIAQSVKKDKESEDRFYGLFLELKREGIKLFKKDGTYASDHIAEQDEVLEELRDRGYRATFAIGFDEAKEKIDKYLGMMIF